jgi:aspartyl aminopeptidase
VVKGVLEILKKEYGIEEEDFLSAELEVVPAGHAREAGFDRSMILSYGQDDRVCAFGSYKAMLEAKEPERTSCCILVDKEEIGSVGATGMHSHFFENAVAEVLGLLGDYSELDLRRTLANSAMLSSDVSSAFDPTYASAFDKKMLLISETGWSSINLQGHAENPVPMTQMQNIWHIYVLFSARKRSTSRRQNSGK